MPNIYMLVHQKNIMNTSAFLTFNKGSVLPYICVLSDPFILLSSYYVQCTLLNFFFMYTFSCFSQHRFILLIFIIVFYLITKGRLQSNNSRNYGVPLLIWQHYCSVHWFDLESPILYFFFFCIHQPL